MNIEKLKWMIERADGFRFVEKMHDVECPDQMYIGEYQIVKNKVRWPLLLQRTIEGLNRDSDRWIVNNRMDGVEVYESETAYQDYFNFDLGIDQAKQSAIDYIYNIEMGEAE